MNSCHFSVCCSRYHSLFKKSRLSWNCEVLAENELSVWDPCEISPALVPMSGESRQNQGSCLIDHISAGKSPICTNLVSKTAHDIRFRMCYELLRSDHLSKVIPFRKLTQFLPLNLIKFHSFKSYRGESIGMTLGVLTENTAARYAVFRKNASIVLSTYSYIWWFRSGAANPGERSKWLGRGSLQERAEAGKLSQRCHVFGFVPKWKSIVQNHRPQSQGDQNSAEMKILCS